MFLLSWSIGIVLGMVNGQIFKFLLAGAVFFIALWFLKKPYWLIGGSVCLLFLGWVYGGVSGASGSPGCDFVLPAEVYVERSEVKANREDFIVRNKNGCRAMVSTGVFGDLSEGDTAEIFEGRLRNLEEVADSSPGYAKYLAGRGLSAVVNYPDYEVGEKRRVWLRRWRDYFSERVDQVYVEPDASLVKAMLLAERGTLPQDFVDQFRKTGTSHVIAISGLHVSLIAGMILALVTALPVSSLVRTVFMIAVLWGYVFFIGAPVSSVRAALFWTIVLAAFRMRMLVGWPAVLILAVVVMISVNPLLLTDVGWQLSVGAVSGIFVLLFVAKKIMRRKKGMVKFLLSLILVSLGASLTTGPLIAWHFGNVSLVGVAANLLVVPAVSFVLSLSVLSILLSLVWRPAALLAGSATHLFVWWMRTVTKALSMVPGVYFENIKMPWWGLVVYYTGLLIALIVISRKLKVNWKKVWE